MVLSEIQQEALDQARKHGGKLIRWEQGGYWTYAEAIPEQEHPSSGASALDWYCTTNTIFALVRRGYMIMDDWKNCSLMDRYVQD
ncbi:hypothetical protein MUG84_23430 [Paenibacillus sp. KQZ6P-2]|uniref:Uncharacterized protein n=1 Tax=Paenibacillus mangrovi TaxID=2931978 RepID=A0A9X2B778_9BACL|nr:hypothetical protein [Paenibacillus mangrovi]MCJ8014642.1 hypothetical protein [Paenibacillus mangrovi]